MAHHGSVGRARVAAELLLLHRLRAPLGVLVSLLVGLVCVAAGVASLAVQQHFASQSGGGRIATLLAHGSSAATAWEGWVAAVFFLAALLRLRRGAPEPPGGRTPVEEQTAGQLRAGLVREYTMVRAGLVTLCAVSVIEAARAARYVLAAVSADQVARTSLAATLVEAAGLLAATVVLALWASSFRAQLDRVGALRERLRSTS
jgi:hypothetical protein